MVSLPIAERIMVAHQSEISAEWKVRFAICIASVAIQAFTKLLFSFIQFALLAQSIYSTLWQAVFFNEFGYYTVFNNILTVLFDTFTNNVSFLYLFLFLI
jgi:hypothetical protein